MKICSYTMMTDKGFAPNPYHGFCTLAACTPNHMNAQLKKGDWIAGFFTDRIVPYLVYYMEVEEVMDFDSYYHDQRFSGKKPRLNGSWKERCGDNIYCKDMNDKWTQDTGPFHQSEELFIQDTRYAIVYIGKNFGYFGNNAYRAKNALPDRLRSVLKKGQGIKYTRYEDLLFDEYIAWLQSKPRGINGEPRDREQLISALEKRMQQKSTITDLFSIRWNVI